MDCQLLTTSISFSPQPIENINPGRGSPVRAGLHSPSPQPGAIRPLASTVRNFSYPSRRGLVHSTSFQHLGNSNQPVSRASEDATEFTTSIPSRSSTPGTTIHGDLKHRSSSMLSMARGNLDARLTPSQKNHVKWGQQHASASNTTAKSNNDQGGYLRKRRRSVLSILSSSSKTPGRLTTMQVGSLGLLPTRDFGTETKKSEQPIRKKTSLSNLVFQATTVFPRRKSSNHSISEQADAPAVIQYERNNLEDVEDAQAPGSSLSTTTTVLSPPAHPLGVRCASMSSLERPSSSSGVAAPRRSSLMAPARVKLYRRAQSATFLLTRSRGRHGDDTLTWTMVTPPPPPPVPVLTLSTGNASAAASEVLGPDARLPTSHGNKFSAKSVAETLLSPSPSPSPSPPPPPSNTLDKASRKRWVTSIRDWLSATEQQKKQQKQQKQQQKKKKRGATLRVYSSSTLRQSSLRNHHYQHQQQLRMPLRGGVQRHEIRHVHLEKVTFTAVKGQKQQQRILPYHHGSSISSDESGNEVSPTTASGENFRAPPPIH